MWNGWVSPHFPDPVATSVSPRCTNLSNCNITFSFPMQNAILHPETLKQADTGQVPPIKHTTSGMVPQAPRCCFDQHRHRKGVKPRPLWAATIFRQELVTKNKKDTNFLERNDLTIKYNEPKLNTIPPINNHCKEKSYRSIIIQYSQNLFPICMADSLWLTLPWCTMIGLHVHMFLSNLLDELSMRLFWYKNMEHKWLWAEPFMLLKPFHDDSGLYKHLYRNHGKVNEFGTKVFLSRRLFPSADTASAYQYDFVKRKRCCRGGVLWIRKDIRSNWQLTWTKWLLLKQEDHLHEKYKRGCCYFYSKFPDSFWMIPRGLLGTWTTGNLHPPRPFINQSSCTGEHVEIKCDLCQKNRDYA
jgi:hypothetical protein